MADFESAVRDALRAAVPTDLEADPAALIDGAARHARSARLSRVAGSATVAVAVAALVATTSWLVLDRPREDPARPAPDPVTSRLCRDLRPTAPPQRAAETMGAAAAVLCPTAGPEGDGWELPGAPLTLDRWIAHFRGGLATEGSVRCPAETPLGRPFTVVVERLDGQRTTYRSADLACGGREAVARYLAALAYQRADLDAANVAGYTLQCSPPRLQATTLAVPRPRLAARHATGLLCLYPVQDAGAPGRLAAREHRAVPLGADQLATVEAALAEARLDERPDDACLGSRWQVVLRLITPGSHAVDGELVELVGDCPSALRLNGYAQWWLPSGSARDLLAGLVPAE